MKVSARIVRGKGITLKRLGKRPQEHTAGTVIMQNVKFGRAVLGDVIEENEKVIMPRSGDMMAVRNWPTARYISRLGCYIDTDTGQRVNSATFVYMTGDKVYYW